MVNLKRGIDRIKAEKGIIQGDIASKLGMTQANASRYLLRDDMRIHGDIERIAEALGYYVELTFIDKESGKRINFD